MQAQIPHRGGPTHSLSFGCAVRGGLAATAIALGAGGAVATPTAVAQAAAGGGAAFGSPVVRSFSCRSACAASTGIKPGGLLRIKGSSLARVTRVIFLGKPGSADDRTGGALHVTATRVDVRVPTDAHSGALRAVAAGGLASAPTPTPVGIGEPAPLSDGTAAPVPTADGYAFPVAGAFTFAGEGGTFGAGRAGRTHEGEDVLANCGVPAISARGGKVKFKGSQSSAGNYVVIATDNGTDMAYMHLREPSPLSKGDVVITGQQVGAIGRTGNASACLLHFEIWSAPGWYSGGKPINPLPFLKTWANNAKSAKHR